MTKKENNKVTVSPVAPSPNDIVIGQKLNKLMLKINTKNLLEQEVMETLSDVINTMRRIITEQEAKIKELQVPDKRENK